MVNIPSQLGSYLIKVRYTASYADAFVEHLSLFVTIAKASDIVDKVSVAGFC